MHLQKNMEENIFKIPSDHSDEVSNVQVPIEHEDGETERKKISRKIFFGEIIITLVLLGVLGSFVFRLNTPEYSGILKDLFSYAISSSTSFFSKLHTPIPNRNSKGLSGQETISGGSGTAFSNVLENSGQGSSSAGKVEPYKVDFDKLDPVFRKEVTPYLLSGNFWPSGIEGWNWRTSWLFGRVVAIDGYNITIEMIVPDNLGEFTAQYSCEGNKTILLGPENFTVVATNINFYYEVARGNFLYTHCLNAGCSKVGNGCILMRDKY